MVWVMDGSVISCVSALLACLRRNVASWRKHEDLCEPNGAAHVLNPPCLSSGGSRSSNCPAGQRASILGPWGVTQVWGTPQSIASTGLLAAPVDRARLWVGVFSVGLQAAARLSHIGAGNGAC